MGQSRDLPLPQSAHLQNTEVTTSPHWTTKDDRTQVTNQTKWYSRSLRERRSQSKLRHVPQSKWPGLFKLSRSRTAEELPQDEETWPLRAVAAWNQEIPKGQLMKACVACGLTGQCNRSNQCSASRGRCLHGHHGRGRPHSQETHTGDSGIKGHVCDVLSSGSGKKLCEEGSRVESELTISESGCTGVLCIILVIFFFFLPVWNLSKYKTTRSSGAGWKKQA